MSPRSSPLKKQATEEKEESLPPREAYLPRGMKDKDLLPKRYEVFTSNYEWVQSMRSSLLGLEAGASPSRREIKNSSRFRPQMAASETELPEVITEEASSWSAHWISSPPRRTGSLCILMRVSRSTSLLHCQLFQTRVY